MATSGREAEAELTAKLHEKDSRLNSANRHLATLTATLDQAQVILQQLDGTILYWNSGAEALYGWSAEEAMGRKSQELLEADLPQPLEEIQAQLLEHDTWSGEYKQHARDGRAIWVSSHWILHRDALGKPVSIAKVNKDVTELKRTRKALRTSEGTVRSLFENAGQGILVTDHEGRITDSNAAIAAMFGYGSAELMGMPIETLLPERYRAGHVHQRGSFAKASSPRATRIAKDLMALNKDGSEFPVEISLSYAGDSETNGSAMAFITDITVRQRMNRERDELIAKLEATVAEKHILLKEVHHRVKNNMAVIVGLLEMQSAAAGGNETVSQALEQSQQRVASMARIHEFLYDGEDLNRVHFGNYVRDLVHQISASYDLGDDPAVVTIEAENIHLPVDRAIPCGLILNELLSNAMKYAFIGGRKGNIHVGFARIDPDRLLLSCADDGVGIPASFDWRKSTATGLRIVQILTKQLHGELKLDRSGAKTRFELHFPERGN
jgi:PAS domain S-box-containing protein